MVVGVLGEFVAVTTCVGYCQLGLTECRDVPRLVTDVAHERQATIKLKALAAATLTKVSPTAIR